MTILPNKYRGIRAGRRRRPKKPRHLIVPDIPFECEWCGQQHAPWSSGRREDFLVFYICNERVQIGRIGLLDYTKYPPTGWK